MPETMEEKTQAQLEAELANQLRQIEEHLGSKYPGLVAKVSLNDAGDLLSYGEGSTAWFHIHRHNGEYIRLIKSGGTRALLEAVYKLPALYDALRTAMSDQRKPVIDAIHRTKVFLNLLTK